MDALSKVALIGSLLAMLSSSPGAQAAGQPPAPTAKPPRVDFGKHDVGARTAPVAVRIDNPTDADLELARVSIPSDFTLDPGGCREPIAPRGWCTVAVRFSPLAAGVRAGELRIEYLAGMDKIAASLSVALTGTGEAPQLSVSPARLSFPRQGSGGRDARQAISLTNHAGGR